VQQRSSPSGWDERIHIPSRGSRASPRALATLGSSSGKRNSIGNAVVIPASQARLRSSASRSDSSAVGRLSGAGADMRGTW